jgi:hypothetical protein
MNSTRKNNDPYLDDLELVNHFIKQQKWDNQMVIFYPKEQGSKYLVEDIRKLVSLVQDSHIELLPAAFQLTSNPRVVLNNGSNHFALINIKTYTEIKNRITECNFFYSENKHDADYRFASLFLMESRAILDLANEIEVDTRNLPPQDFIKVAERTMKICLEIFGKEIQVNNVFEYFFLTCSERYFALPELSFIRRKLMLRLGSIIGGYGDYYS